MTYAVDWEFGKQHDTEVNHCYDVWILQQCNQSGFTVVQWLQLKLHLVSIGGVFIYINVKILGQQAESTGPCLTRNTSSTLLPLVFPVRHRPVDACYPNTLNRNRINKSTIFKYSSTKVIKVLVAPHPC